ncbi:MAG: adenylate/guanylate cyclase domain-containing protein [Woeseiaceae bacterium]|nr:adenylate/guanylate cyclase domain-containing protein [Woeseiaceae bacterium]
MFTDLVDSTRMVEALGGEKSVDVLARHDRMARDLLRDFGGTEVKKSDGFLLTFDKPLNAVRYALSYHAALVELAKSLGVPIKCRVGIHVGEVFVRQNTREDIDLGAHPTEFEGLSIAITGRLMSLADGNQTLLSASAFESVQDEIAYLKDKVPVRWVDHGHYLLKGLENPLAVFEVGHDGIAPLRPPPETEKVRRVGSGLPTILVLPFENKLTGSSHDYFCEGLTDEIITDLSYIDTLRVISRSAAMQLKDKVPDPDEIRRRLGAQFMLAGTARASHDSIRVHVELTNTASNELVWADRFQGPVENIFEIQEDIARNIAAAMKIKLSPAEDKKLAEVAIPNLEAYQYYLRARQEIFKFTSAGLDKALEYLAHGAEIVGDNIFIVSAIGYVNWQYFNIGASTDAAKLDKAIECAEKCLELDASAPDGHRLMGLVNAFLGDSRQTFVHLHRALERNGNDTDSLFWLILLSGLVGKTQVAPPLIERLLRIDPLTPLYQFIAGWVPLFEGRFSDAQEIMAPAHDADTENPIITLVYGQALAMNGETDRASVVFEELEAAASDSYFAKLGKFLRHALAGSNDGAIAVVDKELEEFAISDMEWSWTLAQGYALIGATDEAMRWLSAAVDAGFINYPFFSELDPLLGNVRNHKRFPLLMSKVRQRWRAFDA